MLSPPTTRLTGPAGPTGAAAIRSDHAPATTGDKPQPRHEDHDLQLEYVAVSTTAASANTGSGYISGSGDWADDWTDEGPISTSSYSHSNAAAMWQAILWADGYLSSTSQIDCAFGSGTASATVKWQRDHYIGADGIVGSGTFTEAAYGDHPGGLIGSGGWSGYLNMRYEGYNPVSGGTGRQVGFTRNTDGNWGMWVDGDHHLLSYTYANFK